MKICKECGSNSNKFRERSLVCSPCEARKQMERHREKLQDPEYVWFRKLTYVKHHYGIAPEDVNKVWEAQGKSCAICHRSDLDNKDIVIDHNHETMEFRGILCRWCNTVIGKVEEDTVRLARCIDYIKSSGTGIICSGSRT